MHSHQNSCFLAHRMTAQISMEEWQLCLCVCKNREKGNSKYPNHKKTGEKSTPLQLFCCSLIVTFNFWTCLLAKCPLQTACKRTTWSRSLSSLSSSRCDNTPARKKTWKGKISIENFRNDPIFHGVHFNTESDERHIIPIYASSSWIPGRIKDGSRSLHSQFKTSHQFSTWIKKRRWNFSSHYRKWWQKEEVIKDHYL